MDDTLDRDLFPEPVVRRAGPIVTGRFVRCQEGYPRQLKVGQPVLVAVLAAAAVARAFGALLLAVLRTGSGAGGARRRWKELKKGPEFLVTPLRMRDELGQLYELELHGHVPQSALHPGDLLQVTTRAQKDPALPVRIVRIVNLTTHQLLTPRIPSVWSHLGPALLLQAVLGLLLAGALTACAALA